MGELILRMRVPPMFASVCIRRHEDAPTLPPKRPSQVPPSQNAWANKRPGVAHHAPGSDRAGPRLELIVTRIPLLALFFVSVVGFTLDHARVSLLLMSASALAILLWNGLWKP